MERAVRVILVVAGAYVAAQMLADIASLKIISVGGYAVDAGTLIYPFTFTLRDMIHKVGGKTVARTMIWLAAAINVFMAGFFWLVARWPGDPEVGPQLEFGQVLAPVWGIVVASIVADAGINSAVRSPSPMSSCNTRATVARTSASNCLSICILSIALVGQVRYRSECVKRVSKTFRAK